MHRNAKSPRQQLDRDANSDVSCYKRTYNGCLSNTFPYIFSHWHCSASRHANFDCDSHPYTDRYCNSHGPTDSNSDRYGHHNADCHPNCHPNSHFKRNRNDHTDTNPIAYTLSDEHCYLHPDKNPYSDAYERCNPGRNSFQHRHSNSHCKPYRNPISDQHCNSHRQPNIH